MNSKIFKKIVSSKLKYVDSLSIKDYVNLLKRSKGLIGNSSSGIIEAPSLKTPTINVGNRQIGRIFGKSIFNCKSDSKLILAKINGVLKLDKKNKINYFNPYLKKNCLELIKKTIIDTINLKYQTIS